MQFRRLSAFCQALLALLERRKLTMQDKLFARLKEMLKHCMALQKKKNGCIQNQRSIFITDHYKNYTYAD